MQAIKIDQFYGIQQQTDSAQLPSSSAYDARNMDTSDGNLSVAKGFTKVISAIIPGSDTILKLIDARLAAIKHYVIAANAIYTYKSAAWATVYTFGTKLTSAAQIDYVQTQIGGVDYLIIATGESQMVKVNLSSDAAELFGTGALSYDSTVDSYNAGTLTVTLTATLSAEAQRHAPLDGITINGTWLDVASASSSTVVLADTPDVDPVATNTATIRGGGSSASCDLCDMFVGRLFAAGDPTNPSRLYWSAVPGDGRTIEDWLAVEGSEDASGGYVEIGDNSGDAISGITVLASKILIHKKYSKYTLRGDRPSNFVIDRVDNYSEQCSNASVVVINDIPYWLTASGVYAFDDTGVQPINNGVRYLNTFVKTIYSTLNSRGAFSDNVMYFTCKVASASTYDDTIIVIDLSRSSDIGVNYMIRDGFQVADITVQDGHVYMVSSDRYVCEFEVGTSYDGDPINAYWMTQKSDLGAILLKKRMTTMMFRSTDGFIRVTANPLSNTKIVDKVLSDMDDGFAVLAFEMSPTRLVQAKIENVAGGYFSITGGVEMIYESEKTPR